MKKPNMYKLSEVEGNVIKTTVNYLIDLVVIKTGGNPTFGGNKKK